MMENFNIHILLDKLKDNQIEQLNKQELSYLIRLFEEEVNPLVNGWLMAKWEDSASDHRIEREDLDRVLSKLQNNIESERFVPKSDNKRKYVFRSIPYFQRVAAMLFIPLAIFTAYMLFSGRLSFDKKASLIKSKMLSQITRETSQEYFSPAGTRSKLVLRDSTVVWLNSGSKLLVSENYGKGNRLVKLVGQAYFDVKKHPQLPFIVDLINETQIRVTGTTFSVGAYKDSKTIETVLISGTVYLSHGSETVKMKPSQRVSVNKENNKISITTVTDDSYAAWKDGILIFKSSPMQEVITTLEKWFNVSIQVQNSEVLSYKFTARLDNCSLTQVLDYISYSSPIEYSVKDKNVTIRLKKRS